jgi:hypothetical protein
MTLYGDPQLVLDAHPADLAGRCRRCGVLECGDRTGALAAMWTRGQLPLRRPGLSAPELIGAVRVGPGARQHRGGWAS